MQPMYPSFMVDGGGGTRLRDEGWGRGYTRLHARFFVRSAPDTEGIADSAAITKDTSHTRVEAGRLRGQVSSICSSLSLAHSSLSVAVTVNDLVYSRCVIQSALSTSVPAPSKISPTDFRFCWFLLICFFFRIQPNRNVGRMLLSEERTSEAAERIWLAEITPDHQHAWRDSRGGGEDGFKMRGRRGETKCNRKVGTPSGDTILTYRILSFSWRDDSCFVGIISFRSSQHRLPSSFCVVWTDVECDDSPLADTSDLQAPAALRPSCCGWRGCDGCQWTPFAENL